MSDPRFPGAPPGSYVSDEGWLIVGEEAWTAEEWSGDHGVRWRRNHPGRPPEPARIGLHRPGQRYATDEERRAARRQSWRESKRRKYARQRSAA